METITKKEFFWMKFFSLIPVLVILIAPFLLFSSEFDQWRFVSLAYIILGMPHIFGGFFYQYLSLKEKGRKNSRRNYILVFLFLMVFFFSVFYAYVSTYFIMFVLSFFLIHAVFNETSMYEDIFGKVNRTFVWPFFLVAQAAVMKSMYSDSVIMYLYEPLIYLSYFGTTLQKIDIVMPTFMFIIISTMLLAAVVWGVRNTILTIKKKKYLNALIYLACLLTPAMLVFFVEQVQHSFLITFMILFHVFSWLIFYHIKLNKIRKSKNKARKHIINRYRVIFWSTHIGIIGIFIGANFFPNILTNSIYMIMYSNQHYVLVWSLIHIFTSFINETRIRKFFY